MIGWRVLARSRETSVYYSSTCARSAAASSRTARRMRCGSFSVVSTVACGAPSESRGASAVGPANDAARRHRGVHGARDRFGAQHGRARIDFALVYPTLARRTCGSRRRSCARPCARDQSVLCGRVSRSRRAHDAGGDDSDDDAGAGRSRSSITPSASSASSDRDRLRGGRRRSKGSRRSAETSRRTRAR